MGICFDKSSNTFYLETKNTSYVFNVTQQGVLQHLYYGPKIGRDDLSHLVYFSERQGIVMKDDYIAGKRTQANEYKLECSSLAGRGDYRENMLIVESNNGSRLSDYKFDSFKIFNNKPLLSGMPSLRDGKTLIIKLKDENNKTDLNLFYTVFENEDAISRRCEIVNNSNSNITLNRAYSFNLDISGNDWQTLTLPGGWLKERYKKERRDVTHGIFTIDSKRGASSSQMNPSLVLLKKNTTEEYGPAIGFNLIYSGDFAFKVQSDESDDIRIIGGINDYDFKWTILPKTKFSSPESVMVYSNEGLGKMSRNFHDLFRKHLINPNWVNKSRPIVINNWEATYFDFNEEKLLKIIDNVKNTGIDTFVLDDGWFGNRNDDTSSLGDWFVNKSKLPNGLKPIIDYAHKNGLKFGLWIEPEMISKNSKLYKNHPDWAIKDANIAPSFGRNQFVLDLSRQDVREYIISTITKLLQENEIDYIKWDMNRTITENYSDQLGVNSKELHHRYMLGLYEVLENTVNKFPNVFFEGCASGGARFDAGMLYYFPQIWTSDNSDSYSRSIIQQNTSLFYPLSAMDCHVSITPNHQTGRTTPFSSRSEIAQLGATGYELDIEKLQKCEMSLIKKQIEKYKHIKEESILNGDLYRLSNMEESGLFAQELVSKDKHLVYIAAMRGLNKGINGPAEFIYPKGLDSNKKYKVKENTNPPKEFEAKGSTIMNAGLICHFNEIDYGDYTADSFEIEEINDVNK